MHQGDDDMCQNDQQDGTLCDQHGGTYGIVWIWNMYFYTSSKVQSWTLPHLTAK